MRMFETARVSSIFLKIGESGVLTAGLVGIVAELHVLPYPERFELNHWRIVFPRRIVFALSDTGLRTQYRIAMTLP